MYQSLAVTAAAGIDAQDVTHWVLAELAASMIQRSFATAAGGPNGHGVRKVQQDAILSAVEPSPYSGYRNLFKWGYTRDDQPMGIPTMTNQFEGR